MKNDILEPYIETIDFKSLKMERNAFNDKIKKSNIPFSIKNIKEIDKIIKEKKFQTNTNENIILAKSKEEIFNKKQHDIFFQTIKELAPWRIGPYQILDYDIESEWNSFYKFERIQKFLPNLKNKKIADVGGNNGYFSFRLSSYNPKLILNIEPVIRNYFQFQFLQSFFKIPNIQHEPIKAENISIFKNFFDVIFCLGVIYHQRNPILMLNEMWNALSKNGILILETICFDSQEPISLCPKTYSKMRNVWFLPSPSCLKRWLEISNFKILSECETLSTTTFDEQRKTKDASFESLEDFLNPSDPSKTIEGYHAPKRYIVVAQKKMN